MKLSNYLVEISGVSIFPIISLLLFVVFFVGVLWWVIRMNASTVSYIAQLPIDDAESKINH